MEANNKQIQGNILDRIKKDEIKMTSRKFFLLKWLTLSILCLFFLALSIYIFAYVTFLFVDNGLMAIPLGAADGLGKFIIEIPWTLVGLGLLSLFMFSIASKTFYRLYRRPIITFFLSLLIIIMLSHIVFVESGAMKYIKEEAYARHFQLVPDKLLQFRASQTGSVFVGKIVATTTNSISIIDRNQNVFLFIAEEGLNDMDFFLGASVNAYVERRDGELYLKSIVIVD
jgi:hypothetical protein